jgi:hypothetical protein
MDIAESIKTVKTPGLYRPLFTRLLTTWPGLYLPLYTLLDVNALMQKLEIHVVNQ